ncbi:unnamed protein product [Ceutorhynchus assimilis]|uniref:Uncharacterized protein n=1 Tax=Ceutorhynchus assimilis TaxID=467358 RepID=A0A9N9MDZ4_9CUCU|nr:unnamed protein product [Ceutorhynchus assimilis]
MQRQWKTRRTIGLILIIISAYLFIKVSNYEHKASVFLYNVHPNEPWEFVADFSNMKYLNPTIINFSITAESGNYNHWNYSTEYSEKLSHWPYLPNQAVAHFQIKANHEDNIYFIHSIHKTCMFMNLYCLYSESVFKFSKSNRTNGAQCEETIHYQCPVFLKPFCQREVLHQRHLIMDNLKKKFTK